MQSELVVVAEYCLKCGIESSFVTDLADEGLIDLQLIEGETYVLISQLPELERYTRWYYDLSINIAGIDAIRHLLLQMKNMRQEIASLKHELTVLSEIKVRINED